MEGNKPETAQNQNVEDFVDFEAAAFDNNPEVDLPPIEGEIDKIEK